jgi:ribose 5-phosphate isomerase B
MRIYIGADHAGFELKYQIIVHLHSMGHELIDCGAYFYDPEDPYPPFCIDTARRVVSDSGSLGFVLGRSANGEQMSANKVPGARCGVGWSIETAQLARSVNDAHLLSIGAGMHTTEQALAIVDAFVDTPWRGEPRNQRRIDLLTEFEHTGIPPLVPGRQCPPRRGSHHASTIQPAPERRADARCSITHICTPPLKPEAPVAVRPGLPPGRPTVGYFIGEAVNTEDDDSDC